MRQSSSSSNSQAFETLESRKLLSGSIHPSFGFGGGGPGGGGPGHGHFGATIEFDQAPGAVQSSLDTLAGTDNLPLPTTTQSVTLGNSNGLETYTVSLGTTAPLTRLTVAADGTQITAPAITTETFAALTAANPASATEITAIATALNLTLPTDTTNVNISTPTFGTLTPTFSVSLPSATSTGWFHHNTNISVDDAGNPVGNQTLPFDVIPQLIQTGLNGLVPTGGTPYDPTTSTQPVFVSTQNGVLTYSVFFTTTGSETKVSVDVHGNPLTAPGSTPTTYGAILTSAPLAAAELQTIATDDGITTPIASTQVVTQYTEENAAGTVLYTVQLAGTPVTTPWGGTYTPTTTITVDQLGNVTTLPQGGGDNWGFGSCANFGGGGGFGSFASF